MEELYTSQIEKMVMSQSILFAKSAGVIEGEIKALNDTIAVASHFIEKGEWKPFAINQSLHFKIDLEKDKNPILYMDRVSICLREALDNYLKDFNSIGPFACDLKIVDIVLDENSLAGVFLYGATSLP